RLLTSTLFPYTTLFRSFEVRLDERLLVDLRRTANVEGTHGELRARLADRLRRDDADRLAHVDRRAAGKIAPVALGAHAVGRLAGDRKSTRLNSSHSQIS